MKPKAPELFIYSCSAGSLPSGVHCAVCVMLRFCSFHEPRDERTTRTLALQCGNSMNVLCMAMIDLHSLWSWKRLRTPDLLRNIHLVRRFLSKQLDEHCRKRCLPTQEGTAYAGRDRLRRGIIIIIPIPSSGNTTTSNVCRRSSTSSEASQGQK